MNIAIAAWPGKPIPKSDNAYGGIAYGGIERVIAHYCDGLADLGHVVTLFAHPDTLRPQSVDWGEHFERHDTEWSVSRIRAAILDRASEFDLVFDHTCWSINAPARFPLGMPPIVSMTHVNDAVGFTKNVIYLSEAQRYKQRGVENAPIIRIPINTHAYASLSNPSQKFLLFMGSIVPWKGLKEAAQVAKELEVPLLCAGGGDMQYLEECTAIGGRYFSYVGNVSGLQRLDLLQNALATLCLYNDQNCWTEPGATIVSESAACGTPVIAFGNGCLSEIVPHVGVVAQGVEEARLAVIAGLPSREEVRESAIHQWALEKQTLELVDIFEKVLNGWIWE